MLPPGLSFNAISEKALGVAKTSKMPNRSGLGRDDRQQQDRLLSLHACDQHAYALAEAIDMLHEEGLENVFARHDRHAEATRRAARAWGLEILCKEPRHYSSSLTALMMPSGHDADAFRKTALEHFDISLAAGGYPKSPAKCSHRAPGRYQ